MSEEKPQSAPATSSEATTAGTAAITFDDEDTDPELLRLRQEVETLQEDDKLQRMQEAAIGDESARKSGPGGARGAATKPNTSIFVGNLDSRTTEADLRIFFDGCGTIGHLTVLKDHRTGQPKGTAYIQFATEEEAQGAIRKDGQSMHGKPLRVMMKRENIPASQRGGRGVGVDGFAGGMHGGRGGRGGASGPDLLAALSTLMAGGFDPTRGRGGFFPRGRGRGRGRGY